MVTYYNRTGYEELTHKKYTKEKRRLQIELVKLQEWVINENKRIAIVLEGRDAAGKGSTIQRFVENLIPKNAHIVELGVPTKAQNKRWFPTWEALMPNAGEMVFYDRSWYSRAMIQPTMGYCTEEQYKYFMRKVNDWEKGLVDEGIDILKIYLSVSQQQQLQRFRMRQESELRYWKFSPNDLAAAARWEEFTLYKEAVFSKTSTEHAPWIVINADNKLIARLNAMRYVLGEFEYDNKEALKEPTWTREQEDYSLVIDGIEFNCLSLEQYNILRRLSGDYLPTPDEAIALELVGEAAS